MKYLLYPGCSLEKNARNYLDSFLAVAKKLGMEFQEIEDWNCCGAFEYLSVNLTAAYSLVARNLALAAAQKEFSDTIVAPCSACYLNLAKTNYFMSQDKKLNGVVNEALAAGGLSYQPGTLKVRHALDILVHDVSLDVVKAAVVRPLTGLRIAPYYGCIVPRPDYDQRFESHEYPTEMDNLLRALGAEVVYFPEKTHCCGGHMTSVSPDTAYEMIRRPVASAVNQKADVMAVLCPMCQLNLDAYQQAMNRHYGTDYKMPVLYLTQLIGLAFGFSLKEAGIGQEIVDARQAIARIGVAVTEEAEGEKARKPRRDKQALPMPRMPQDEEVRR